MAEDHGHDEHGGGGGDEHGKGGHKAHKSHGAPHGGGHEEHAGAPEWLISFADNVALLMGFFVILLAMNMGPKNKAAGAQGDGPGGYSVEFTEAEMRWIELQVGMGQGFNNPPTINHKDPKMRKLAQDYAKVQEQRKRSRKTEGTNGEQAAPNIQTIVHPNLTIEFDPSKATLSSKSREDITSLVRKELLGKGWVIEVRGHVSALEAKSVERAQMAGGDKADGDGEPPLFPAGAQLGSGAGYALSYQRAFNVAEELVRNGIPWRNLRIVACSDMDRAVPRTDNDPSGHLRNARVQIIQTKDQLPNDPMTIEPGQPMN